MKTIYIISAENDFGEAEGVFEENGTFVDMWASNDGDWRHEYFNPFMLALGIKVLNKAPKKLKLEERLKVKMEESWG